MQVTFNTPQLTYLANLITDLVTARTAYAATAAQSMTADTYATFTADLATLTAIQTLIGAGTATTNTGDATEDNSGEAVIESEYLAD